MENHGNEISDWVSIADHPCFVGTLRGDELRGRGLRFVLVDELMNHPSMTVAQMVTFLAGCGYDLGGRASKIISDALRWEVRRNRVKRLARGVYAYHRTPASTARRIKLFAQLCHRWIVAATRHEQPPPIPPDRRNLRPNRRTTIPEPHPELLSPPWTYFGWLWSY